MSLSGRVVATGTSVDGSEGTTLRVLDSVSGLELPERVDHARWSSVAWRHDDRLLQAATADREAVGPILLRTYLHAGHGAGKPLPALLEELAEVWGFLAWCLGMDAAGAD